MSTLTQVTYSNWLRRCLSNWSLCVSIILFIVEGKTKRDTFASVFSSSDRCVCSRIQLPTKYLALFLGNYVCYCPVNLLLFIYFIYARIRVHRPVTHRHTVTHLVVFRRHGRRIAPRGVHDENISCASGTNVSDSCDMAAISTLAAPQPSLVAPSAHPL